MSRTTAAYFSVLVPLALCSCSRAAPEKPVAFAPARPMGIVRSDALSEISGLVASRQNPGVLWVHNDSGEAARVFALDAHAELLGTCTITGAQARDWEDIALGPGPDPNRPYLYLGDIGDNQGRRPDVTVYRVPEPRVDAARPFGTMTAGPADALRLVYPDRPRDAETLLVDPLTRDIYLIAKRELFARVYRAPWPQSTEQPTRMKQVTLLPWSLPTGGDVSPDGRRVIVRSLYNASLWDRPAGAPLWRAFSGRQTPLPLADEPQGEAICFDAQGAGYFTISEGRRPTLYYFAPAER
jgi:hypothetical protein